MNNPINIKKKIIVTIAKNSSTVSFVFFNFGIAVLAVWLTWIVHLIGFKV